MLAYLEELEEEGLLLKEEDPLNGYSDSARSATSFIDLGCGNGHMLFSLRTDGWTGRMVGIDYSEAAIKLAQAASNARAAAQERDGGDGRQAAIHFAQHDIFADLSPPPSWLEDGFDAVIDKGTFDAVSLSSATEATGRRLCEGYRDRVEALVRPGGVVLITSCNWTEEELKGWFEGGSLELHGRVRYPSFVFGGMTGQSVVTLCFRHREL